MSRPPFLVICILFCAGWATGQQAEPAASLPAPASHQIDFSKDIKPLFEAACIQCHAKGKTKGGLSLETRDSFLKGGDTGPAAVPGKSAESLIVKLVAGLDPDSKMPKKGKKWTLEQIGLLRAWIDQGALWDPKITFKRPEPANLKVRVVEVRPAENLTPVDDLVSKYFAAHSIEPAAPVEDRVFARRAYLDSIGLVPTSAQLAAFVLDPAPDKRQKLVHKLLANKRGYADNWLTFWNDLLRNDYRGTGFIDGGRRQISGWLYNALIGDEPYDRFVAQLVNPSADCEGFSRGIIWRGTVNASMLPPMQAAQNTAQVFMGINLKCASCHDSFVNDWTLADAYGLAAVFSDGPLELVRCDQPTGQMSVTRALYPELGTIDPKSDRPTRMQRLSEVLTSRQNGRLSRTIVNRLWARLLGHGLVEPLDDMDKPAWNSDLLDWLAEDLVAHQYDLKHTIEVIMSSRAYQLPTTDAPATPENKYFFRGPQLRRLTAEQFCDAFSSLTDEWARFPDTLDIDFSAAGLTTDPISIPNWIWTDETVEAGQARADDQARFKYDEPKKPDAPSANASAPAAAPGRARGKRIDSSTDSKPPADAKSLEAVKPQADAKPQSGAKAQVDTKAQVDAKASAEAKATADAKAKADAAAVDPRDVLPRHKVVFRKRFSLDKVPAEAYAAVAASQSFSVIVNGKPARGIRSDGERAGRIAIFDMKSDLVVGENAIVLEVTSHTGKSLNDVEVQEYPASRNHLNKVSGVGMTLRMTDESGHCTDLITDDSWKTFRAPDGSFRTADYEDGEWPSVAVLPDGVEPVDEGPALAPITRHDFANEPIHITEPLRKAISTAAQPGGIRASLLVSDTLMNALDRPNREQVMTSRITAATTLQALELTNGSSFDQRLKRAARKMTPQAKHDPDAWVDDIYLHMLSRAPTDSEAALAREMLGEKVTEAGVADFLWAVTLLPEFDFVN
jgi:hypothetical protein